MYKPINGWTKQKILDLFESRKFEEGATIELDDGTILCKYLTDNGNKCAVGMFIPDGHPGQKFDSGIDFLLDIYKDLKNFMPLKLEGLIKLQVAHDGSPRTDEKGRIEHRKNSKTHMIQWVKDNVKD